MAMRDDDSSGSASQPKKSVGVAALIACAVALVIGVIHASEMQLGTMPTAAATTTGTPWVPRPRFAPKPAPQAESSLDSQGATRSQAPSESVDLPPGVNPMAVFLHNATGPFNALQASLGNLNSAIGAHDSDAARGACSQLSEAGKNFDAILPSPDQQLTSELRAVVDSVDAASDTCLASSGQVDFDAVSSQLSAANPHLSNAQAIAQRAAARH